MADQVNAQVTDAVTQSNVKVVAEAPAQALGSLYQVVSQATGIAVQNSVHSQQAMNQITQAIVSKAATQIMALSDK